jgi:hypothetical protein
VTDTQHPAPDQDPRPDAEAEPESDAEGEPAGEHEPRAPQPLEAATPDAGARRRRRVAFAALRGAVVVVVAAVGYQLLIPQTRIYRSRLNNLVVIQPGVKAFDVKPAGAAEQQASRIGLPAAVAAAKRDPHHTGIYSIAWTPTQATGAGLVAILLPSRAEAVTALAQLRQRQLAADSYKSAGLTRRSTFGVAGVPASSGGVYLAAPTPGQPAQPTELGVAAFSTGRVVSFVQVLDPSRTQADLVTVTRTEYGHLRSVEPGFTLKKVTHPAVATALWIAAAVLVLLLATGGPWAWRMLGSWRRRREQERLDRLVQVGGQVITKRHR